MVNGHPTSFVWIVREESAAIASCCDAQIDVVELDKDAHWRPQRRVGRFWIEPVRKDKASDLTERAVHEPRLWPFIARH